MASTTPTRRPWTAWLQARWPTAAALAIAALLVTVSEIQTDQGVTDLSQAALLLPLEYLVIAKLRRRQASWPVILALFIPFVVLGEQEVVDRAVVVSAVALVVLVWGRGGRAAAPTRLVWVQALGMLGFGALALAGLAVDPDDMIASPRPSRQGATRCSGESCGSGRSQSPLAEARSQGDFS
jgi:hypothetical protein